jgi:hypothetical protein
MAYTLNIPSAGQSLAATQNPIKTNFNAISSVFGIDHVTFNATGEGKHNKVTFPTLSGSAPAATELSLWSAVNATTSKNELYIRKNINPAGTLANIPFTASKMSNTAYSGCLNGWSYLPSGLLIKWGACAATTTAAITVNVAALSAGPSFTQVFSVYISPRAQTANFTAIQYSDASAPSGNFQILCQNVTLNTQIKYLVIGV